jgi:hypothetical protein
MEYLQLFVNRTHYILAPSPKASRGQVYLRDSQFSFCVRVHTAKDTGNLSTHVPSAYKYKNSVILN